MAYLKIGNPEHLRFHSLLGPLQPERLADFLGNGNETKNHSPYCCNRLGLRSWVYLGRWTTSLHQRATSSAVNTAWRHWTSASVISVSWGTDINLVKQTWGIYTSLKTLQLRSILHFSHHSALKCVIFSPFFSILVSRLSATPSSSNRPGCYKRSPRRDAWCLCQTEIRPGLMITRKRPFLE